MIQRQLREGVKVKFVSGGIRADRFRDQLAVLNRILDQFAGVIAPLPEVKGGGGTVGALSLRQARANPPRREF